MKMSNIEIEKLIEEYRNKASVSFDGNDEFNPFYGHVIGFARDTDGSIYVTLRDAEDDCFDIDWKEFSDAEFDFDEDEE